MSRDDEPKSTNHRNYHCRVWKSKADVEMEDQMKQAQIGEAKSGLLKLRRKLDSLENKGSPKTEIQHNHTKKEEIN